MAGTSKIFRSLTTRFGDERAQTIVEYALLVTTISIGAIAALAAMTNKVATVFQTLGSAL